MLPSCAGAAQATFQKTALCVTEPWEMGLGPRDLTSKRRGVPVRGGLPRPRECAVPPPTPRARGHSSSTRSWQWARVEQRPVPALAGLTLLWPSGRRAPSSGSTLSRALASSRPAREARICSCTRCEQAGCSVPKGTCITHARRHLQRRQRSTDRTAGRMEGDRLRIGCTLQLHALFAQPAQRTQHSSSSSAGQAKQRTPTHACPMPPGADQHQR